MKVLNILTELSDAELHQLKQNALAKRGGSKADEAEQVLSAVDEEWSRRTEKARLTQEAVIRRIREKVSNLDFERRVEAAFTDLPPMEWERAALTALADRPGATTEELSAALGYSGMYMNWFGHVCRDREPWLGPAIPGPDGKITYSDMLIDFSANTDPTTGKSTSQWRLKPEAASALKRIAVIK